MSTTYLTEAQRRARLEDLQDLANWGVPYHEAAQRVGLSPESLHRYLQKHDRDLSRRLTQNSLRRGLTQRGTIIDYWGDPPKRTT